MTATPPKPRVLIIAEAANPEWVSVPLIGWSLSRALGEVAQTHIVTQIRNREAFLRAGLTEGVDFTAIDSEKITRPLFKLGERLTMGKGKGWTALQAALSLAYPYFERLVWRQFSDALKRGEYDIVHRITPLSPTAPSSLAAKCQKIGVPFVIGPLNGGVPWPKGFDAARRKEREYLSYLRGFNRLRPAIRKGLKNASAILVASRFTQSELDKSARAKSIYLPENAVDPARFSVQAMHGRPCLNACFVGRMVPYKGPDILLEAAAPLLKSGRMTLVMIGDGPMLEALKNQARSLGIDQFVKFTGWLDHKDVQAEMVDCNLFAFPSIREFGGGVVLEAMALGIPPLIVDYAGPGELVRKETGFSVPIGSRQSIINGFQRELTRLQANPDLLRDTGTAGRDFVERHFTWSQKAQQIAEVYNWVLSRRAEKPSFFG